MNGQDIVTLVPAYKPTYLPDLLNSLRLQTHKPRKIVFGDDSPDGVYRGTLMSDAFAPLRQGLNIECIEGPRRGGMPNLMRLLDRWGGESALVHLLLDDDVLYPEFYERHLVAHASGPFSCTVSRRWSANDAGFPVAGQPVPPAVSKSAHRLLSLDADFVFQTTAMECKNWFGEFSNAIFSAAAVPLLFKPEFGGVSYAGLWDLGAFMAASEQAPLGYVQDHLGYFRTGGQGNSAKFFGKHMKAAHVAYAALGLGGLRIGRYTETQARLCFATVAGALAQRYGSQDDMQPFIALLPRMAAGEAGAEQAFVDQWHDYLREQDFF